MEGFRSKKKEKKRKMRTKKVVCRGLWRVSMNNTDNGSFDIFEDFL